MRTNPRQRRVSGAILVAGSATRGLLSAAGALPPSGTPTPTPTTTPKVTVAANPSAGLPDTGGDGRTRPFLLLMGVLPAIGLFPLLGSFSPTGARDRSDG